MTALKRLIALAFTGPGVSDEGMKAVAPMTDLRELWVGGPKVTDAGVKELSKLTKLRELDPRDVAVTQQFPASGIWFEKLDFGEPLGPQRVTLGRSSVPVVVPGTSLAGRL